MESDDNNERCHLPSCCTCKKGDGEEEDENEKPNVDDVESELNFEDALINALFRRAIEERKPAYIADNKSQRIRRSVLSAYSDKVKNGARATDTRSADQLLEQIIFEETKFRNITLNDLHHFTSYDIQIVGCQTPGEPGSGCSSPTNITLRTEGIAERDLIDNKSIFLNRNRDKIKWKVPQDPNGKILAFQVELFEENSNSTAMRHCVLLTNGTLREASMSVPSTLGSGAYSVRVRTVSSLDYSEWVDCLECSLVIDSKPLLSRAWKIALSVLLITGLILLMAAIVIVARCAKHRGIAEMKQIISANPQYYIIETVYTMDEWEVRREDVVTDEAAELGSGGFGVVVRGWGKDVQSKSGVRFGECAVKMVRDATSPMNRIYFLQEASIMKQFNTAYIVKLYGIVSDGHPAMILMELMENGNLRDYLRSRRSDADENCEVISLSEGLQWIGQIADGMCYLEEKKFVHRDLACRNCMINKYGVAKIGDFGMARDIEVKEYYRPDSGKRLMPVRWMSPETLKDGIFTSRADVWSFGVVIWEIATLGRQPYPGLGNEQVCSFIIGRGKPQIPTGCPEQLAQMMNACWVSNPQYRPPFRELVKVVQKHMNKDFLELSYTLNSERKRSQRSCSKSDSPKTDQIEFQSIAQPETVKNDLVAHEQLPLLTLTSISEPVQNRTSEPTQKQNQDSPIPNGCNR